MATVFKKTKVYWPGTIAKLEGSLSQLTEWTLNEIEKIFNGTFAG